MGANDFYVGYYEDHYFSHHGILGQKWGIRRYQNPDGSLTTEGRTRYTKSEKMAEGIYKKYSILEPKITKDVQSAISSAGSKIYGLEHRKKTKESLSRKIVSDRKKKNITTDQSAKEINDALRYTSVSNDDDFVSNYNKVKKNLAKNGYKEIKCKNYFDLYRQGKAAHKQVTSVFSDKEGNVFEIQFQTPSSIKAKELKTPLYEEVRKDGVSEERKKQIVTKMDLLAKKVKDPKGVDRIKTYG